LVDFIEISKVTKLRKNWVWFRQNETKFKISKTLVYTSKEAR